MKFIYATYVYYDANANNKMNNGNNYNNNDLQRYISHILLFKKHFIFLLH